MIIGKRRTVYNKYNGHCAYCGKSIDLYYNKESTNEAMFIDHILPKCRGGHDATDNLNPACRNCNAMKGGSNISEFKIRLVRKIIDMPYFSREQIKYLEDVFDVDINKYLKDESKCWSFYFEKINKTIKGV